MGTYSYDGDELRNQECQGRVNDRPKDSGVIATWAGGRVRSRCGPEVSRRLRTLTVPPKCETTTRGPLVRSGTRRTSRTTSEVALGPVGHSLLHSTRTDQRVGPVHPPTPPGTTTGHPHHEVPVPVGARKKVDPDFSPHTWGPGVVHTYVTGPYRSLRDDDGGRGLGKNDPHSSYPRRREVRRDGRVHCQGKQGDKPTGDLTSGSSRFRTGVSTGNRGPVWGPRSRTKGSDRP